MRQPAKYSSKAGRAKALARFGSACLLAIAPLAATGGASPADASFLVRAEAGALAPGSYLWEPSLAPSGSINVVVDLTLQRLFVYRNGTLVGISTIASGKPGYETPTGSFTVLEKQRIHHSNKYDDAPMPYMQRLSWSGLAMHGGHPRGYPASHGCIRLPMGFAAALFKEQTKGMQVVITGHAPSKSDIMIANGNGARANSQCCKSNGATEADNLQATGYGDGQNFSNAQPGLPPIPTASPDCTIDREPADETGADDNDMIAGPREVPNGCSSDPDPYRYDPDRARDAPPPDLPPPPR